MDEAAIESLNARGEGLTADGRPVRFALPGERVRLGATGELRDFGFSLIEASPDRAEPICRYFGLCGGCAAQHMGQALYARWKRGLVVHALARAGVAAQVDELVDAHGAGRRRATFHARFLPHARDEVGFMRARAHEIVEIERCPLFAPEMAGAPAAARALAGDLRGLGKPLDIQVTATRTGLDVDIRGSGALEAAELEKLARTAEALDLARVANHGRTIVERRPPIVAFGAAEVVPPAGGFLQATVAGEAALAGLAESALGKARKVADLFCGAGALALRLAAGRQVYAADADAAAIQALKRAGGGVSAEARDLFQRPLAAAELERFDAVLFDPPRAGALAQVREIAKSRIANVVAVSCNAETFARDARILIDGGLRLERVTPVDQFRYSPHVEIVAAFRRPKQPKPRRVFG